MSYFIKAVCKATDSLCWVNMDYVVDVFEDKEYDNVVIAYTFDNERGGYTMNATHFRYYLEAKDE